MFDYLRSRASLLYRRYLQGPDHPSKLRLIRILNRFLFPKEGLPFPVFDDVSLFLHPGDGIEYDLLRGVPYEPLTVNFIRRNLHQGNTFALAGANNGYYVVLASRLVGPSGIVVGIEPQPGSAHKIRQNLILNHCSDNIRLVCCGLGGSEGLLELPAAPEDNSGHSSFVIRSRGDYPYTVWIETLTKVFLNLKLSRPDLMVLDVEGYEINVLEGITAEMLPKILIIEAHPIVLDMISSTQAGLEDILRKRGYKLFSLTGSEPLENLPENNIVAVLEKSGASPQF
jgi:FkbM family methyltransferase